MNKSIITGNTVFLGDNIDTDAIIPARFLGIPDEEVLGKYFLCDLYPDLSKQLHPGSILIAGKNFGCGSSREHAPLAVRGAGIACVIAQSYARIFYRNAVNIGLPVLECDKIDLLYTAETVTVDLQSATVRDEKTGTVYQCHPIPEFILDLQKAGGLLAKLEDT